MRVATYNVHDCLGIDKKYDPDRVARVLAELDADLIAIQEITLDESGELLDRFQQATGLVAIQGSLLQRGIGRYGNLLLSGHSVLSTHLHDISVTGREPRGVIEVQLDLKQRPLRVFATHLGLQRRERSIQVSRLAGVVANTGDPALILGDFNSWGRPGALRALVAAGFQHRYVRSFPTRPVPVAGLDRILVRPPLSIRTCRRHTSRLARMASDHFPIIAELEWK